MKEALIDTGPILAFFSNSDKYSKVFQKYFKNFQGKLYTSLAVVTEVSYMLEDIKSAQLDFIDWISLGAINIFNIESEDFKSIWNLMKKYSDTPMDFADATLVFLSNKYKIYDILTFDSDFDIYHLKNNKIFNNLLKNIL